MSGMEPSKQSRFAPYKSALTALSVRTGTPLPSLALSFAVLHELTALVPLVGVFYGARTLGVGETIVTYAMTDSGQEDKENVGWVKERCRTWVDEGEAWAGRIGRRYGVFGYEKGEGMDETVKIRHALAGDVANAVFAYGLTKVFIYFIFYLYINHSTIRNDADITFACRLYFLSESASLCIFRLLSQGGWSNPSVRASCIHSDAVHSCLVQTFHLSNSIDAVSTPSYYD